MIERFVPESDRELIAVYPDAERSAAARRAVLEAGVPEDRVYLDDPLDRVISLRTEMHDEVSRAWIAHGAFVYPGSAARGLVLAAGAGALIGAALAFPLALIDFGSTYWVRLAIWLVVGVGFGGAVAVVAGPAAAAPRPGEHSPTVDGSTLRVADDSEHLRALLADFDPLHLDEITHEGDPLDTISRAHSDRTTEVARDMAANAEGDDFNPQR